jgi:allophanate hydrolase
MWDRIDVLVVPTAPTHYTIEQLQADPVTLNRNLGAYTNFVNLLDYAALSVPSSLRQDGLPFGITFVGRCASDWQLADLGQRYHHATGLPHGRHRPAAAGSHRHPGTRRGGHGAGGRRRRAPVRHALERATDRTRCPPGARGQTAADYRLFALPGTTPPKPGLLRVAEGTGASIALEIWDMPLEQYGSFVALIGAPLGIGTLRLADGAGVQGFVCEQLATEGAHDITHHGGWRSYMASLIAQASSRPSAPGAIA